APSSVSHRKYVMTLLVTKPWRGIHRIPRLVTADAAAIARDFRRSWRVLWTLTLIETQRKYAGSVLGTLWYPLYSALLLGSYCFVYLVVFRVRYRELGTYDFVLFVFSAVVPSLGFREAAAAGPGLGKWYPSALPHAALRP